MLDNGGQPIYTNNIPATLAAIARTYIVYEDGDETMDGNFVWPRSLSLCRFFVVFFALLSLYFYMSASPSAYTKN